MDIILYLLQFIQYQHKQICWLLNFICRYIPLKQWAFDDSHSPKYQKFKIDELPLITDFRQDWTYKDLIPYYEKTFGKKNSALSAVGLNVIFRTPAPAPAVMPRTFFCTKITVPKVNSSVRSVMRDSPRIRVDSPL